MKRAGLLLLSAGLLAASLAWPVLGWLGFLWLVPAMAVAVRCSGVRRRTVWALLWGVAIFTFNFYWSLHTLHTYGRMSWPLAASVFPLLAVYQTLPFIVWFILFPALHRRHLVLPVLALPLLIRVTPLIYPYTLASTIAGLPWLVQTASWWGEWGLDALLVMVNLLLFTAWRDRSRRPALIAAGIVAVLALHGGLAMRWLPDPAGTLRCVVLQPCVRDGDSPDTKERKFFAAVRMAADKAAEAMVIVPESSLPDRLVARPDFFQVMTEVRKVMGARALLYNAVVYRDGRLTNSQFLMDGSGQVRQYDKHHLILFGERFPLYQWFRKLPIYAANFANFSPGPGARPLELADVPIGTPICLEGIFEGYVSEMGRRSALLVNPTDDEWFGPAHASRLHFAQVRLKAVENRRWLVRAANTGYSVVVDPAGRVVADLPFNRPAVLPVTVGLVREVTLFQRIHRWLPILFLIGLAAGRVFGRRGD